MARQAAPPISRELINWLHATFPHRVPNPSVDETNQVWFDAGVQSIVHHLETRQAKQDGQ